MKRILLSLFAALISLAASAQFATVPLSGEPTFIKGELKARGSRIFYDGALLSKDQAAAVFSDFGGIDRSEEYLHYRSAYKAGVGLSVGGASLLVAGSAAFFVTLVSAPIIGSTGNEVPKEFEAAIYGSLGSAALGAVVMIAGIPTAAVYQHRIKKLAGEYNSAGQAKPALTFGPATSGLGIAMTF